MLYLKRCSPHLLAKNNVHLSENMSYLARISQKISHINRKAVILHLS